MILEYDTQESANAAKAEINSMFAFSDGVTQTMVGDILPGTNGKYYIHILSSCDCVINNLINTPTDIKDNTFYNTVKG